MADKEVYFNMYCIKCKHFLEDESNDICNDCLATPANEDSHKPVNYTPSDTYLAHQRSQKKQ